MWAQEYHVTTPTPPLQKILDSPLGLEERTEQWTPLPESAPPLTKTWLRPCYVQSNAQHWVRIFLYNSNPQKALPYTKMSLLTPEQLK